MICSDAAVRLDTGTQTTNAQSYSQVNIISTGKINHSKDGEIATEDVLPYTAGTPIPPIPPRPVPVSTPKSVEYIEDPLGRGRRKVLSIG